MKQVPEAVAEFLSSRRVAVAGVSRSVAQPANAAAPGVIDGLMVVTHPDVAEALVRQAVARGIRKIWFHRSFGTGSVSEPALRACVELGVQPIVGGCPLMSCEPVDTAHRCMRWWLGRQGRVPR